jgi:hypothetical protein
MRFAWLGFLLFVSACGSVKADAGNDAPTCGGTIDANGDCVCPPRFVSPECTACAPGWSGTDCATFSDNFNRNAGALGANYADIAVPLADDALIVNNRACGDVQAVGILSELINSPRLSAQVSFDPGNVDGQEVTFLLSSDPDLATLGNLFLVGCEGGGGTCNLKIGSANGIPLVERQLTEIIPAGVTTRMTLAIDDGGTLTVALPVSGMIEQVSAALPDGFTIQRFGFVVGREPDGTLSCIDDLSVEVN